MRQFSAVELKDFLGAAEKPPLLLDVREPWEYEASRIEGARHIPMREIPASLDQLDPQRDIIVMCHHGVRSLQVAYFLRNAGFERVINLQGGIDAWSRDVDPGVPTY